MAAKYRQSITLNASVGQILPIIKNVDFFNKFKIDYRGEDHTNAGSIIKFSHDATATSWGIKITITITPVSSQESTIEVYSACSNPLQFLDWGINKRNVCEILDYIKKAMV